MITLTISYGVLFVALAVMCIASFIHSKRTITRILIAVLYVVSVVLASILW